MRYPNKTTEIVLALMGALVLGANADAEIANQPRDFSTIQGAPAEGQGLRIFESEGRFAALIEARKTCQPLVLQFYASEGKSSVGRRQLISAQERIRRLYSEQPKRRDEVLHKAVVLLLPVPEWRDAAINLGVAADEGLASLSPFELLEVNAAKKWGGIVFR